MKQHRDFYNLISVTFAASSHAIASQLVSDGQKYISSINCGDVSSQQTGAVGVRHQPKGSLSLSHKKKGFIRAVQIKYYQSGIS